MDLMEITEKERLSREDAAARLRALADALARHNDVEFDRGGLRFKVHVPDEVDFKFEIEIDDGRRAEHRRLDRSPSQAPAHRGRPKGCDHRARERDPSGVLRSDVEEPQDGHGEPSKHRERLHAEQQVGDRAEAER